MHDLTAQCVPSAIMYLWSVCSFREVRLGTVVVSLHWDILPCQLSPKMLLVTDITLNIKFQYTEAPIKAITCTSFDLAWSKNQRACTKVHIKVFHFFNLNQPKKPRGMSTIRETKNIIWSVCYAQLSSRKITQQPMQTSNDPLNNIWGMI